MATENEPAKLLLPYLQRADELQKHEPLIAYYCNFSFALFITFIIVIVLLKIPKLLDSFYEI